MIKLFTILVAALLWSGWVAASDPEPVQPEHALVAFDGRVANPFANMTPEQMKAMMLESQRQSVIVQFEIFVEPENIELVANFSWQLFESLVAKGFTEEQALEIVKSIGLPSR